MEPLRAISEQHMMNHVNVGLVITQFVLKWSNIVVRFVDLKKKHYFYPLELLYACELDKIKNNCSIIIKYFTSWFGICLWCIKVLKYDKHYITVQHSPLFSHVFIFHINPLGISTSVEKLLLFFRNVISRKTFIRAGYDRGIS